MRTDDLPSPSEIDAATVHALDDSPEALMRVAQILHTAGALERVLGLELYALVHPTLEAGAALGPASP